MLPSLFVSHGAPTLILEDGSTCRFLRGLSASFGRPTAVVAVSAHWETDEPCVSAAARPTTIHDFYGFPDALYRMNYPAPGAPALAERAAALLSKNGIANRTDAERGLDHGAWVPLMLMYPAAEIPVLQLSVQAHRDPAHHLAVGRALAPLRDDDVLILGSGGAVHNLRALSRERPGPPAAWAQGFDDWLVEKVEARAIDDLTLYRECAPDAVQAHPRDEHLLPLFVALGAGGEKAVGKRVHAGFTYGSLSMAAFSFS
ncbi:MAG: DODA-type extradiol aromatic ring-opening family dioxygenase [Gemmatimonadota bacterium]